MVRTAFAVDAPRFGLPGAGSAAMERVAAPVCSADFTSTYCYLINLCYNKRNFLHFASLWACCAEHFHDYHSELADSNSVDFPLLRFTVSVIEVPEPQTPLGSFP